MYKKYFLTIFVISFIFASSLFVKSLTYDGLIVDNLREYEKNIVDYSEGDDWFNDANVEYGDMGAYDDTFVEPDISNGEIKPLGQYDSSNFSYFVDLEADMYYQVYETSTNVYFVQWNPNNLVRPTLIEYYSK